MRAAMRSMRRSWNGCGTISAKEELHDDDHDHRF
jgi:hypothetical protein